jgi:hypothetical protein
MTKRDRKRERYFQKAVIAHMAGRKKEMKRWQKLFDRVVSVQLAIKDQGK